VELGPGQTASAPEFQGLKRVREFYRRRFEAWLKQSKAVEREQAKGKKKAQSFTDEISQLLVGGDQRKRH
jgi:hypothetical protein